jgi:hypothetical protein
MFIPWLKVLEKLNSLPGFAASAQHVALYKDAYTQMEKEAQRLQSRCNELEGKVRRLSSELGDLRLVKTFESYHGLLWKPVEGGFERTPYCPKCKDHTIMTRFPPGGHATNWLCSVCDFHTDLVPPPKT